MKEILHSITEKLLLQNRISSLIHATKILSPVRWYTPETWVSAVTFKRPYHDTRSLDEFSFQHPSRELAKGESRARNRVIKLRWAAQCSYSFIIVAPFPLTDPGDWSRGLEPVPRRFAG